MSELLTIEWLKIKKVPDLLGTNRVIRAANAAVEL